MVVWVHERGKQAAFEADGRTPSPELKRLLAGGAAVLVPDVFLTGESGAIGSRIRVKNDDTYFGYNTGYNRSVFAGTHLGRADGDRVRQAAGRARRRPRRARPRQRGRSRRAQCPATWWRAPPWTSAASTSIR